MSTTDCTLLYVEDDAVIRTGMSFFLKSSFTNVLVAPNGHAAWELFQQHAIDVVVTDLQMPVMNGQELVKKIRAVSSVPVFITSAYEVDADLQISGYFEKPLNALKMVKTIQNLFDQ